ncbi:hypothetical protein [Embleya scabrispora]|uniref:hypothetical protein n=1 Tax=Embleya scabrispora TaxID=159449 RepID=UPI00117FDDDC|nr:hypothetical protein [Embleya scabrispora]
MPRPRPAGKTHCQTKVVPHFPQGRNDPRITQGLQPNDAWDGSHLIRATLGGNNFVPQLRRVNQKTGGGAFYYFEDVAAQCLLPNWHVAVREYRVRVDYPPNDPITVYPDNFHATMGSGGHHEPLPAAHRRGHPVEPDPAKRQRPQGRVRRGGEGPGLLTTPVTLR